MTKNDVATSIAEKSDLSKKDVQYVIDNFLESILQTIENDDRLEIRGFGTFYKATRKSRKIFSPIKNEYIEVAGKEVLAFKASKSTEKIKGA